MKLSEKLEKKLVELSKKVHGESNRIEIPKGWSCQHFDRLQGKIRGIRLYKGLLSIEVLQQNPEKKWKNGELSPWAKLSQEGKKVSQFSLRLLDSNGSMKNAKGVIVDSVVEVYKR